MHLDRMGTGADFSRYMDLREGWLDRRIFSDAHIYEQELYRIFARAWLFVAHESQLPKAGDFLTTHIGATKCASPMPAIRGDLFATITAGPLTLPVSSKECTRSTATMKETLIGRRMA
jgi:hypothetical protein